MTADPPITVLMPVYNAGRYLSEAVESVLGQTFGDFELVAVDDGSTDGSADVLAGYAARDPRVRLTRQPVNGGYVRALLAGAAQARGGVIARMDADDVCHPDRLGRQWEFLRGHPDHVAVGTLVTYIDEHGQEIGAPTYPADHAGLDGWHMSGRGCGLCHPTAAYRREAFERVGRYRPEYEPAEDFDLWLRLAEVGRIALLPDRLVRYRVHRQSVSRQRASAQDRAIWRGVRAAVVRRGHPLARVPFADLGEDEQVNWIDLALDVGQAGQARRWAAARVARRPTPQRVKQFGKAALGPWLGRVLPVYDRLRGRAVVRTSAFDRGAS
jgi:glycosyltransferase involved in cell wall biosynthesis